MQLQHADPVVVARGGAGARRGEQQACGQRAQHAARQQQAVSQCWMGCDIVQLYQAGIAACLQES
jgi:hypothetical protein